MIQFKNIFFRKKIKLIAKKGILILRRILTYTQDCGKFKRMSGLIYPIVLINYYFLTRGEENNSVNFFF